MNLGKKIDKDDKILIILKLKYIEKNRWKWQNSKYKLEGEKLKKYKI